MQENKMDENIVFEQTNNEVNVPFESHIITEYEKKIITKLVNMKQIVAQVYNDNNNKKYILKNSKIDN